MKKHLHIHWKVLLLIAVYLFFHFTNAFFANRLTVSGRERTIITTGTVYMVHLQKTAKTTVSETRLSFAQLIRQASKFFSLLLFFAIGIRAVYIFLSKNKFTPTDPPYLRLCVIRI